MASSPGPRPAGLKRPSLEDVLSTQAGTYQSTQARALGRATRELKRRDSAESTASSTSMDVPHEPPPRLGARGSHGGHDPGRLRTREGYDSYKFDGEESRLHFE